MNLTPAAIARDIAVGRIIYGAACMSIPRLAMGPAAKNAESPMIWMGRAFGVRDLVIGAGTLLALRASPEAGIRMVEMGAAADGLDLANAVLFRKELDTAGLIGVAALAVPATAGGIWAARRLRADA